MSLSGNLLSQRGDSVIALDNELVELTTGYLNLDIETCHEINGVSFSDVLVLDCLFIIKFDSSQEKSLVINRSLNLTFYQVFDLRD